MFDIDKLESRIEQSLQKNTINYKRCSIISDESSLVIRINFNGDTISRGLEFKRVDTILDSLVDELCPEYESFAVLDLTLDTRLFIYYNYNLDSSKNKYPNKIQITF